MTDLNEPRGDDERDEPFVDTTGSGSEGEDYVLNPDIAGDPNDGEDVELDNQ